MTLAVPVVGSAGASTSTSVARVEATGANRGRTAYVTYALDCVLVGWHLVPLGLALPWWQRLLGAVPGLLAIHAWAGYLNRRDLRLPFLEYGLSQLYLFWGLPTVLYDLIGGRPVHTEAMTEALLATGAVACLTRLAHPLGCRLGRRLAPTVDGLLPRSVGPGLLWFVPAWIGVGLVLSLRGLSFLPIEFRQAVKVFIGYAPLYAYLYLQSPGAPSRRTRLTVVLVTAVFSFMGLFTGMLTSVLQPLVLAGLLSLAVWRHVPWRLALAVSVLMVIIQPAKAVYRSYAWSRAPAEMGVERRLEHWEEAISEVWSGGVAADESPLAFAARFNQLGDIGLVFEMTPDLVPYDLGQQWKYLPLLPIPRFLWPSKPNLAVEFNDRFNIQFGLQTEEHTQGSTNTYALVVDGYWNFGWLGVGLVGALLGVLLGLLRTAIPIGSWGGLSVAAAALSGLAATQHLAGQMGGLVQSFVGIAATCWMMLFFVRGLTGRATRG
ncbi:hypothetical protein ACFL5O_01210 [Myxococcota bacterium]